MGRNLVHTEGLQGFLNSINGIVYRAIVVVIPQLRGILGV